MPTNLNSLKDQVTRNDDVNQSVVILLQGLKTRLDEAGTDPAKLNELSDALANSTDALAEAVAQNASTGH